MRLHIIIFYILFGIAFYNLGNLRENILAVAQDAEKQRYKRAKELRAETERFLKSVLTEYTVKLAEVMNSKEKEMTDKIRKEILAKIYVAHKIQQKETDEKIKRELSSQPKASYRHF